MKRQIGTYLNFQCKQKPWMIPVRLYKELRDFYLRGIYGWSPSDTWNFNTYLEDILEGARIL